MYEPEVARARKSAPGAPAKSRKKKKRSSSRTLAFSIVVLFLFAGAVGVYSMIFNQRAKTVSMSETPIATADVYQNTGDGILYQTDGKIHFYHLTDQKKNYTYGTGASDIRMAGSSELTAVYNDVSMQVIGKKKPLQFAGKVLALECGEAHVAVLQQDEAGNQTVLVLTADGEQTDQLQFDADQYIVDFGFYKVLGEMLWIQTLSITAGTPTTTITTYDVVKRANSGVIQIQNQLIDGIYITPDSMFVVGTNQIIRYTHSGNKEIYRTTVYGYRVIDYTYSGTPTFLMTPRGGDMHSVKMLTLSEGADPNPAETFLQLPTEGVAAYMMNGKLVVVSQQNVYTYTLKGKLSLTATLEKPAEAAVKLTEKVIMLASNGIYYLATIK